LKYHDINSKPDHDTEWVLQQIANELAEANRLKRLELNLIYDINKQSLEDQA